ncbi:MAG: NAD(P)H-quinone oxidoreductase [Gammaproteobacteria bacterium]|uniref:NAD(P)H-quinone oxidoreductase n=1 Tax=OM182 bacterium MED-G24 TaxID=1986255 RepID=A0A2A5WR49_9GAMM|nr:NAD(P)H-quinone oxidoreductase [Gammaproteobacteria bacterium]PDH38932.1 MAG: NAD(P)H-quinone oxidoreductase [OM182 bacterium MED-G24]RPG24789.1 MAG: NAD(P)H-quinone oxidoreductase [Gammaproteobacteria bacterium TMED50]
MKAIVFADDQSLSWSEVESPALGAGEVLIEVKATAINRADLLQRAGGYPPPPGASPVLGLECAGDVVGVGEGVDRFDKGDQVCALLAGGGYAELASVPVGSVLPMPEGLDYEQAASLPEVYATAWINLYMEAGMAAGEKALLHAGASGVGTAGIQLCRAFGQTCFVTAGDAGKIERCIELGASGGHNRHEGSFLEAAGQFADGQGIDVILDPVGGRYLSDNLALLGTGGRLVLIGLMGGPKTEINLALLMGKRARVIGSTLRSRPIDEKASVMSQLEQHVWPKISSGEIKPVIDSVYSIQDTESAHARMASNESFGKIVLTV